MFGGGVAPGGDLAAGAYYRPILIIDAAQNSEVVQDEAFGSVLVALPFDTDDEGISLLTTPSTGWPLELGQTT